MLRALLNFSCIGITIGLFLIVSCGDRDTVKKDPQIIKQVKIEAYFKNANREISGRSFLLPQDCPKLQKWYLKKRVAEDTSGTILSSYLKFSAVCNAFSKYTSSINLKVTHDFISSVDFTSIALSKIPWPCDLIEMDPDACSPDTLRDSVFDHLLENYVAVNLIKGFDENNIKIEGKTWKISESKPCKLLKGRFEQELFYNKIKKEFYCAKPSEENKAPTLIYSLKPLIFSDNPLYADFNHDGFLDAILEFAAPCSSGCGSLKNRSGNVIFTRKSSTDNIEIITSTN
jgi:hypothetical protein